jgi:hypothetical protein
LFKIISKIIFTILGYITNDNLIYLSEFLKKAHIIENLLFGEDIDDPWQEISK